MRYLASDFTVMPGTAEGAGHLDLDAAAFAAVQARVQTREIGAGVGVG